MSEWEVVCGLEIHCQIVSKSKVFSGASTEYGSSPNENVSLIDVAMPGMLPTLNEFCVEQVIKTGLALNAKINNYSEFSRKNYFYADLPAGYQITQYKHPIVGEGEVEIELESGETRKIGIERIHIEQDTGKSLHDVDPNSTLLDFNRAGVGLMELVTKPDFRTPEEAGAFLRKLRSIVRYLGTCDGNMDEGSMRCDASISVRPKGETTLRNRAEMKNINSIKFVMQAIEVEAKRQIAIYENGGTINQETRQFDAALGESKFLRDKESAHDYRYFPEPDLLPLTLDDSFVEKIKGSMPELPDAKKKRFMEELGLKEYDARILSETKEIANYFESALEDSDAKKVANWMMSELFAVLNEKGLLIEKSPVSPVNLGKLVRLIDDGVISGKIAKEVFEIMVDGDKDPEAIVAEKGLKQETDLGALEKVMDELMASKPEEVAAYRLGRNNLLGFFVGQVLKASGGKANPAMVNEMVKKKLG